MEDEFILHGGNRSRLRNRAIILAAIAAVAIAALVNALHQAKGDNNGSVGAIVVPVAIAVGCLGGVVMTLSQWWEDVTFFRVDGTRLSVSHGTHQRGHSTWYEREAPLVLTAEGASGSRSLFLTQGDIRARLGNVDPHHVDAWLRGHGFTVKRA